MRALAIWAIVAVVAWLALCAGHINDTGEILMLVWNAMPMWSQFTWAMLAISLLGGAGFYTRLKWEMSRE